MKILDRYIRNTIYLSTAFVALILVGIQSFLQLVEQFRHIGQSHYGIWQVFLFVPMQMPAQFYQLFPMAGFLGCLIGLGRLATSSQLIVMRASGISIARITMSVLKAAVPMVFLVTLLGEGVGPIWQRQSFAMRQHALHPAANTLPQSVWMREGNIYTHVGHIASATGIEDVTRYHFNDKQQLVKATFAKFGKLQADGRWLLSDLSHTIFLKDYTQVIKQKKETLNFLLKPSLEVMIAIDPMEQTLASLYRAIQYRASIGLSVSRVVYTLSQRLLQPVTTLIMICLSVPFVFGSLRSSTMGVKVLIGIVVGFVFYMLNQLFGPITLVYQYPPILAAITPTIIFLVVLVVLLSRVR